MAQAFVTTTSDDYRWPDGSFRRPIPPHDELLEALSVPPADGFWITTEKLDLETEKGNLTLHQIQEKIDNLRKDLLRSVYQVEYCSKITVAEQNEYEEKSDQALKTVQKDNELLNYCNQLYTFPKTSKILPPLPHTRKLFGFLRNSRNYTPLTEYQECYGKMGYQLLNEDNPLNYPDEPTPKLEKRNLKSENKEKNLKETLSNLKNYSNGLKPRKRRSACSCNK